MLRFSQVPFCLLFLGIALSTSAQDPATPEIQPVEQRDYDAAVKSFEDGLLGYERAESEFREFVGNWPKSKLRQSAYLYWAKALYQRGDHQQAVNLLLEKIAYAGRWADRYQYWIGESWFAAGNYEPAAAAYGQLLVRYRDSSLRFQASYNEALARRRLGQFNDVISLLENPASDFRLEVDLNPTDKLVSSGHLLLAETRIEMNDAVGAQEALNHLNGWELDNVQRWRRQYLLCRLALTSGLRENALTASSNCVTMAMSTNMPSFAIARTYHLQSGILEEMGRHNEAIQVLTNNLSEATPANMRRDALMKVVDLQIEQGLDHDAIRTLREVAARPQGGDVKPLAYLTLGELQLKQFYGRREKSQQVDTNLLSLAAANLSAAIDMNADASGQAVLQRGWCQWELGNWQGAGADFLNASELLPRSTNHAIALFKLGETWVRQNDPTNAMSVFGKLIEDYQNSARVRRELLDHALYNELRAAIEVGDQAVAERAVSRILDWFPRSFFSDRSLLYYGQALNRSGKQSDARLAFEDLIDRFPRSTLAPQVKRAIARTYEQEGEWSAAAKELQNWPKTFPEHPSLPEVEYDLAWLNYQSGTPDVAFQLFTNFVHRFPNHSRAPKAEKWIADYYFNRQDFNKAQERYQLLFQSSSTSTPRLKYEARFAAGRAAFAGRLYADATNAFITLFNDPGCPDELKPSILMALGDTSYSGGFESDPYGRAINAYTRITNAYPNHRLSAYALGKIGNCHLQLAGQDPTRLDRAAEAFRLSMTYPNADSFARTKAEMGLAVVLEKQQSTAEALNHYANVFYEKNLRPSERHVFDEIKEAGYAIARIMEQEGDYSGVLKIYQRLQGMFPSIKSVMAQKISRARKAAMNAPR
ncbi:MAG: TolA-binding protein [Limisphaerales bacterium]|jgi:TolA-binding protein